MLNVGTDGEIEQVWKRACNLWATMISQNVNNINDFTKTKSFILKNPTKKCKRGRKRKDKID